MTRDHFIAGDREIAHRQVQLRMGGDDQRFQPAVMLHAVGQRVADESDVVAFLELDDGFSGLRRGQCNGEAEGQIDERFHGAAH